MPSRPLCVAFASLTLVLLSASVVQAQAESDPHAVQPERPTLANHAGTIAAGWVEVEGGVERDRFTSSDVGYTTPSLLKIGLTSHLQLGVFGSFARPRQDVTGLGDVGAALKWRLFDDVPIFGNVAIVPAIKLPTGSAASGTGTGTTDGSLLVISSHAFGPVSVDINVGYTRRSGAGTVAPTSASLWTVAGAGPLFGRVGWAFECHGYPGTGDLAGQAPIVALLGGPTLRLRKWLAFDAGTIVPLAGPQPRALYAGAVYNVGRLWQAR